MQDLNFGYIYHYNKINKEIFFMNSKLDNFKWHCETKLYKYANDENYKHINLMRF